MKQKKAIAHQEYAMAIYEGILTIYVRISRLKGLPNATGPR